jgi:hypothetical protein
LNHAGRFNGEAIVRFASVEDAGRALERNGAQVRLAGPRARSPRRAPASRGRTLTRGGGRAAAEQMQRRFVELLSTTADELESIEQVRHEFAEPNSPFSKPNSRREVPNPTVMASRRPRRPACRRGS